MYCKYHGLDHADNIYNDFLTHCQRLSIPVRDGECPIHLVMENDTKLVTVEPEYLLVNQDVSEVKSWPTDVDLLITRLPVLDGKYGANLLGYVANQAFRHMSASSLAFVIVPAYKEEKDRPFKVVDVFTSVRFKFIDTIVWVKNKFIPTQGGKRLNNVYDFVFMFAKGDNYHLNRPAVSYLKTEMDGGQEGDEYLCPGNVWRIKVDDKDAMPLELIDCLIKLSNLLPNSRIIDPFMDTGIVLRASINNGHSFWGCEKDKNKFEKCKKLLKGGGKK